MRRNLFLLSCLLLLCTVALWGQNPAERIHKAFNEPAENQFWWFHTVQIGVMLRKTHCKLFKIALIWEWIWLKLI